MKSKIISLVKYVRPLYKLYYYIWNFLIGILKLFVKPDDKLILFNSFGGKKYDDSPKAIFETMRRDNRFDSFVFVWAFHEPEKFHVDGALKVKTDTLQYFVAALKARCWVTNSTIERGLAFKGKNTFYFNTWHGTPIKKMGADILSENLSFRTGAEFKVDIMAAQSDFEADIFSRVFKISREKFLKCGLPRNDILVNYTQEYRQQIRKSLGIAENKMVILYAPTFREYEKDALKNCVLLPPINLLKWENELEGSYCLLFRAHYEVAKTMQICENNFVKDMSSYPALSDLMIAADILISDYSSIFFDFSIMDKPMLHFTYDYETYSEKRGMYFDIREHLNGSDNEDGIMELLTHIDLENELCKTKLFRKKYLNYYGNAVSLSLESIYANIVGDAR